MEIFRDKGKLHDSGGGYLDDITCELFLSSQNGTGVEWWGKIPLIKVLCQ